MLTPTVTEVARLSAHRYDIAPRVAPRAPRTSTGGKMLAAQVTARRVLTSAPILHGPGVR